MILQVDAKSISLHEINKYLVKMLSDLTFLMIGII